MLPRRNDRIVENEFPAKACTAEGGEGAGTAGGTGLRLQDGLFGIFWDSLASAWGGPKFVYDVDDRLCQT